MMDRTSESELEATPLAEPGPSLAALEERVRRLEDSVAQLQNTQPIEERVASRVLEQVKSEKPASSSAVRESAALVLGAGRHILPAAVGILQAQADTVESQAQAATSPAKPSWLIVDLFADLRTLFRMCRDPRYRSIWASRALLPLALVALIVASWLWLQLVPGFALVEKMSETLATVMVKVVDLFLAFVLYKALQREIRRYRETVPDQAPERRS